MYEILHLAGELGDIGRCSQDDKLHASGIASAFHEEPTKRSHSRGDAGLSVKVPAWGSSSSGPFSGLEVWLGLAAASIQAVRCHRDRCVAFHSSASSLESSLRLFFFLSLSLSLFVPVRILKAFQNAVVNLADTCGAGCLLLVWASSTRLG